MRRLLLLAWVVALGAAALPVAQQGTAPAAAFTTRCASCHGDNGIGGRAPALADSRRLRGMSDAELEGIIRNGTSNGMPPFASLPAPELAAIVAHVRSLNAPIDAVVAGDRAAGESFFFGRGGCAACHMVGGRGSASGPDLSNIGRQLRLDDLTRALVEPSAAIAQGYATVNVKTADGRSLRGFARNEGNYVLPLQTLAGELIVIDKRTATISRETGSIMPPLAAARDEQRDLLAYLSGLNGVTPTAGVPGGVSRADFDAIARPRPGDWPTYHGRLHGNRHSAHAQIDTSNVQSLALRWVHSLRGFDNEMTPLVLDGIMYITGPNQVSAIDALSGREIWRYSRPRTPGVRGDAARGFNRGAAVLGPRVFLITDNAHLIAVSRANGALLWDVTLPERTDLPYGGTTAPLVINDLVVAGVSGGDEGIRGFIAAYHADTGKQAWRFWTVPARGEPAADTWKGNLDLDLAGGATWLPGSYDVETDTLYWPTGNPYPDTDGTERQGDNLYTNAVLALNPRTGALKWHYQFTPHDLWDWDAQEPLVLVDANFGGRPRKLLLQANRNGFFYVLDRTDGTLLVARPFVDKLTWASGIGADGRPIILPGNTPDEKGVLTCPAIRGATNWMSTAFHPATRLFYVMTVENCYVYRSTQFGGGRGGAASRPAGTPPPPPPAGPPAPPGGGGPPPSRLGLPAGGFNAGGPGGGGTMILRAIDIETGKVAWAVPQTGNSNNYAGTLSTDGGLVFYGRASGEFAAVDARTGADLWHFETQETWKASPMTYVAGGRQHVAIVSGANVLVFALPAP